MRWNELFEDLEAQLDRELAAELDGVVGDEERMRLGRLTLRERIDAMPRQVTLRLVTGELVRLERQTSGAEWIAGELGGVQRSGVVPLHGIAAVSMNPRDAASSVVAPGHPSLAARIGLAVVLRDLCRRRTPVDVDVLGSSMHGTIDRVGRDHFDVAVHEAGELRRASAVRDLRIVPFASLVIVRFE